MTLRPLFLWDGPVLLVKDLSVVSSLVDICWPDARPCKVDNAHLNCHLCEWYYERNSSFHVSVSIKWAASSEFVSSSIPSWQTLTAHAQPFRGARDLAFCLKVPLDSLLVWASSEGSGETARMRRLAWIFAARIGYKYQIRLTRSKWARAWQKWARCAQGKLRLSWASTQSDQSLLCALRIAKDLLRLLHADSEYWSDWVNDRSLWYAHRSFCW